MANKDAITTVGKLREALKHSDDDEPLIFDLEYKGFFFRKRKYRKRLKCTHLASTAGGRVTKVCLEPEGK